MSFTRGDYSFGKSSPISRKVSRQYPYIHSNVGGRASADDLLPYKYSEISSVVDDVFDCTSIIELFSCIRTLNTLLHGTHCSLRVTAERSGYEYAVREINDCSNEWISTYLDRRYFFVDPIVEKSRNFTGVFFWGDQLIGSPMVRSYMAAALSFGIGPSGITFVATNNFGDTFALSFSSNDRPDDFKKNIDPMICDLCEATQNIINVFSEMSLGGVIDGFRLTDDQIRILYDISHGLAEENLSAERYLYGSYENVKESILNICGAKTLAQAAAIAMKQGLLETTPFSRREILSICPIGSDDGVDA